uniref:Uncharacterized protein n=1 Tax=Timema douglasi TaxID=61478 RepID=A0A7R8VSM3_TIMDO|nr:unnamed protein product [Timema douglasi]
MYCLFAGVSEPRVSVVEGRALPNARVLSTILYPEKDVPDEVNTLAVMQFGQLISHDTALSPDQQSLMSESCCTCLPASWWFVATIGYSQSHPGQKEDTGMSLEYHHTEFMISGSFH